ncbi:hypothetical protein [Shewanella sp. NIFS-20-20]|uniref:hypothetical protein n=1 Tax=Shewanella sp. NIFS-20-20 TaxID=2853806 RepID=UPI001C462E1D|nr:hypothetical protein [Shewanella sp. NIFS-20-20]MBV7316765.1 hypothetical protein [Shewanella sp. NIFS-20-20]
MTEPSHTITTSEHHLPTLSSKVMFWRPRYLSESQWLQHIPFYFWLAEVLQPKTVVEPNLNSAVGYFAICQAVDKLNLDSFTYAAFGKECDVNKVTAYNHDHYREFSHLSDWPEQEFINEFDDASIDLLLLKHDSPMLASEAGRAELQKKLTDNAVVLIHGSKLSNVRKLCSFLRKTYPSFELTQGQGVLLLCMGKQIPERLELLINQAKDVSAQRLIQNIYGRLGSANEDAWQRQVYERRVHELTTELQAQTHNIQQIQGAKQAMAETLAKANDEIASAKAHQAQLAEQLTALGEETAANREQKQQLEQEKARLDKELLELKQSRQLAANDVAKLQQDIDARFDELAKLTQMLVDAEHRLETLQQDNQALREQLNQSRVELEKARAEASASKQQLSETSTQLNARLTQQQADNSRLKDSLNQAQKQASEATAKAKEQADELHITKRKLSELQVEHDKQMAEKMQELSTVKNQLAAANNALKKQQELNALLERDQQVAADKISQLKQSELNLQQSLNDRFDELATLTNMLQQKEQEFEAIINEMQAAQLLLTQPPASAVSDKLKNSYKAAKQRRAKARQFAKDVELIRQSELFDEAWYLAQYPEAKMHKHGAAGHYLEKAVELGANPSAAFDGNWYLQTHQDVKNSGMNPLFHYLKFGHKESRLLKHIQLPF